MVAATVLLHGTIAILASPRIEGFSESRVQTNTFADHSVGHSAVLSPNRRSSAQWQRIAVNRDPSRGSAPSRQL